MNSFVVPVSTGNVTPDTEYYVYYSAVERITVGSERIVLVFYGIAVILSIIQTFWKNKRFDRLLSSINETYSDGKFQSVQICINQKTVKCYKYADRFSYIPNPKRSILFIICTHIQILMLVALRTLITRRSETITDCTTFHYPYEILICENNRDPCEFNKTNIDPPKCIYYHCEMANLITTVTTIITWYYALRYFIIKLVRLVRWINFRDNDHPKKSFCCCRPTVRTLKIVMYIQYCYVWIYLSALIITGFVFKKSLFRSTADTLGYTWSPIVLAIDRISSLGIAFAPELTQNWLQATSDGTLLNLIDSPELSLVNVEHLLHVTNKKSDSTRT